MQEGYLYDFCFRDWVVFDFIRLCDDLLDEMSDSYVELEVFGGLVIMVLIEEVWVIMLWIYVVLRVLNIFSEIFVLEKEFQILELYKCKM